MLHDGHSRTHRFAFRPPLDVVLRAPFKEVSRALAAAVKRFVHRVDVRAEEKVCQQTDGASDAVEVAEADVVRGEPARRRRRC